MANRETSLLPYFTPLTAPRFGHRFGHLTVLEPFGGGAPILRACHKLGRACDSIERDDYWHAAAVAALDATARHPSTPAAQASLF